jgi:hypothetical protein
MGFWSDFVNRCKHARDRVERARDPETHEPIPYAKKASLLVRLGAWALGTKYGTKVKLSIFAAVTGSVSALCMRLGIDVDHTAQILLFVSAMLAYAWERFVSFMQQAARGTPPVVGGQSLGEGAKLEKASAFEPYEMPPTSFWHEPFARPEIPLLPRMARAEDNARESHGLPRREPGKVPPARIEPKPAAVPSFRVAFAAAGESEWHEKHFENLAGAIAFRDKQRLGGNQAKLL